MISLALPGVVSFLSVLPISTHGIRCVHLNASKLSSAPQSDKGVVCGSMITKA